MSARKENSWIRKSQELTSIDLSSLTSSLGTEEDEEDLAFFDGVLVDKKRATYAARDGEAGVFLASSGDHDEEDDDEYESDEEKITAEVGAKSGKICEGVSADGTSCSEPGSHSRCVHSLYGKPKSAEEVERMIGPNEEGGIIWRAHVLPNDFDAGGKVRWLKERDYDHTKKAIKPRRGLFPITEKDLFSSLVRIGGKTKGYVDSDDEESDDDIDIFAKEDAALRRLTAPLSSVGSSSAPDKEDESNPRWVFSGVMNGWPGLTCLELRKIEVREVHGIQHGWTTHWSAKQHAAKNIPPTFPDLSKYTGKNKRISGGILSAFSKKKINVGDVRATFRSPSWASRGWSKESPGLFYWYEGAGDKPRMCYGTDLALASKDRDELKDAHCTRVHMVNHRYAVGAKETTKDRLTYHSFVFLEWDHGKYGTIVEIGYLNGVGGYCGKVNWFDDKDDKENGTAIYRALPPEMVKPWKDTMSEIRCYDVPASNLDEMMAYIKKYTGPAKRFVDPRCSFSHDVRLTYRSRRNIATYLLNYIRRDQTYNELKRNCQTFTADLCGFLAGKNDVRPFHPVNQIEYHNRMHFFLYESSKYKQSDLDKRSK